MNIKDIEVGKCYEILIWEDDPIIAKCVGFKDGYLKLDTGDSDVEMSVYRHDQEMDMKEVPEMRWLIHVAGAQVEAFFLDEVKKWSDE